jgi:hypothetical protein
MSRFSPAVVTRISFCPSSLASPGSSAFGAYLRARSRSFLPALVAFAAAPCDDIDQIITAVIVGNLGACFDVLDGAYDDLVAYPVGLGIGSARMGLKFISLLGRKLAAFVFVTMKALFLIGAVAKSPKPVRERPIRKALLRAISDRYDDSPVRKC